MQKIKKQSDIYKESWFTTVSKDFKRNRTIYLLLIPVLLYYIMFHYAPMYGSVIAFQNFKPQKGILGSDFVGLMHFKNFFNSFSSFVFIRKFVGEQSFCNFQQSNVQQIF